MMMLANVWRELAGLFVDDGALALAIIAVVVVAGIFTMLVPHFPSLAGATLLFGCLGVLFFNVVRGWPALRRSPLRVRILAQDTDLNYREIACLRE
jgi:hypothetical protein